MSPSLLLNGANTPRNYQSSGLMSKDFSFGADNLANMFVARVEQQPIGCIGARIKTSSETIMERSRPSQRHSSISLLHGTSSNLYKDRSVTMSGGLENHRSSHQYVQSSAWDQNSKLFHDNSNSPNFVNHGLLHWQEQRKEWVGKKPEIKSNEERKAVLSRESTYEELLTSDRHFPQPIPLPEMVEFLVDVWKQEGLFDHVP